MEQYLRKSSLGSFMNALGVHLALLLAAEGFFIWLWGLRMTSLLAGGALGLLLQMTLTRIRRKAADSREEASRRVLGGEMALEELLLLPPEQAHQRSAGLLALQYPITVEESMAEGCLCSAAGERLLVMCAQVPAGCPVGCSEAVRLQRACKRMHADRGILCVLGKTDKQLADYADACPVPVRIIPREALLELAGHAAPATDEQLIALKHRRRRRAAKTSLVQILLDKSKAKRYMAYGIGLLLLSIVTGLRWYPVPGAICLGLGVLSRCRKTLPDLL